jgi:nucleoside-diphosphate-sugar epimerase
MRKVIVLGGSGFIGRHCISKLLTHPDVDVHAVSRIRPRWAETLGPALQWHEINLLAPADVQNVINLLRPAYALHLAWYVGHGTIWTTPENIDWTAATLSIARTLTSSGCKRLVIAGSCAEYAGAGVFKEDFRCTPETLYGIAKNAARMPIEALCRHYEVSFAWPRLFHMYGPWENPKRLISSAIRSLLEGREFASSDGQQLRDFLHVEDVGDVLVALLFSEVGGVVNIGSGEPVRLAQLLNEVGRATGRSELIKLGARPRALNDPDVLIPDLSRQAQELGWSPRYRTQEGIRDTVEWWRRQAG